MKGTLNARVTKLEKRSKIGTVPIVIFGEYDREDDEVIGIISNGIKVGRGPDELVAELIIRSGAQLRQKIAFLEYGPGKAGDTCVISPKIEYS